MRLLGAEVRGVSSGSKTLKDAISEAMRDWVTNVRTTHYILGPRSARTLTPPWSATSIASSAARCTQQILEKEGRLPTAIIACVGGGSNAIGAFYEFIPDQEVRLIGVEAGGRGTALGEHAARFHGGSARRSAGHLLLRPPGRRRPDRASPTPSPPASTTPPSAPSTPRSTTPAAPSTPRRPMPPRSTPSSASPAPKASCPRLKAPTP